MNNVKKDNATAPFDTIAPRAHTHTHYILCNARLSIILFTNHKSPLIWPMCGWHRCAWICFFECVCLLLPRRMFVCWWYSHTRAHTRTHENIYIHLIWNFRCDAGEIERMLILGVWYIHYIEGWESMYRTINWLLNQAVAACCCQHTTDIRLFRYKTNETTTTKTQNSTAQQQ